jgi:RimJ/RimL family protein N-acetyltransferase
MNLPIATPRGRLRAFRDADLDAFLAYRNDPEVSRLQEWEGISREAAAAFLRKNGETSTGGLGQWQQIAIALDPGDLLVGDIGLFRREDGRSAELGFTLARAHQGRGLAHEALAALIGTLFEGPGLERLESVTDARNASAMALLSGLGFQIRATADAVFKGAACREHTYALSREARRPPSESSSGLSPVTLADLAAMPDRLEAAFRLVPDGLRNWTPPSWDGIPGERFSALGQVCHVRDIEVEGYHVRIARMLAEEEPSLASLDSDAIAASRRYDAADSREALDAFRAARAVTLGLLHDVSAEQLGRRGTFAEYGPLTLRSLVHYLVSHDHQHLACLDWLLGRIHAGDSLAAGKARG